MEFLSYELFGVKFINMLYSFGIILVTLIGRKAFNRYISRTLTKWAQKTAFRYDDIIVEAIRVPAQAFIISIGLYFALFVLRLPREPYDLFHFVNQSYKVALSFIAVWTVYRLTDLVAELINRYFSKEDESMAQQIAPLVRQALRVTVVIIGGIMIVQNLGYSVGSLLAGMGIGGLAIALAAQDTLANLFGTFVMFTDQPFKVGDWIEFKGVDGDVEQVGFRSTKIRTWSKSLVSIPNKLFASEIIENWSAMPKRRVKMTLGLTYDTPPEKMEEYLSRLRDLLANDEAVDQSFFLVNFTDYGPSSLNIMVYYFTVTTVWKEYLHARERINLQFMRMAREVGVSFAFPSQTVYFGNELPGLPKC